MYLKTGFMLREIANQWIVVPLGQRTVEFNAIMNLSETGALIWKGLEQKLEQENIIEIIMEQFDVDRETLTNDFVLFMNDLESKGLVDYE